MLTKGIFRSALIAGASLATGDLIMQGIEYNRGEIKEWNVYRTARFGIVGLTLHGPYFHIGFGLVERVIGKGAGVRNAILKMGVSQVTLFPVFLSLLFPYISLLEGKSKEQALEKLQQAWWPTFVNGALFWPAVNMINFLWMPPGTGRVLCVSTAGIIWNTYISYVNYETNKLVQVKE